MSLKLVVNPSCGTLIVDKSMTIEQWAELLYKAMAGFGTDEEKIINFLISTSLSQRLMVSEYFHKRYNKSLIGTIKSELSGDLRHLVLAMMKPRVEMVYDAFMEELKGSDYFLMAILISRSNSEKQELAAFAESKGKSLGSLIDSKTSGLLNHFLMRILNSSKEELSDYIKENYIYTDRAEDILDREEHRLKAGLLRDKINEKRDNAANKELVTLLVDILYVQNRYRAMACVQEYQIMTGSSLINSMKKCDKTLKYIVELLVNFARHPGGSYCQALLKAGEGIGTNENGFDFVFADRFEIDLMNIKQEFEAIAKKSLEKYIKGETSGDYGKLLLRMLSPD